MTALPPRPHGSLIWPRGRHRLRASQSDCGSMARHREHGFSNGHGQILWTLRSGPVLPIHVSQHLQDPNTGKAYSMSPVRLMYWPSLHIFTLFTQRRILPGLQIYETDPKAGSLQQRPIKNANILLINIKLLHIMLWVLMWGEFFFPWKYPGHKINGAIQVGTLALECVSL